MFKKGDTIVTKPGVWHLGENIGDRLGKVVDTASYVVVKLYDYHSNPVKLFARDIEIAKKDEDVWDEATAEYDVTELLNMLDDLAD
jgi:hypothetical protein